MNVLVLLRTLWPEGGGGELAFYLYIKLLIKNGVNVRVIVLSSFSDSERLRSGLPILWLPVLGRGKYIVPMPTALRRLGELVKWSNIIYSSDPTPLPHIKQRFKKPIVIHVHSYAPLCPVGTLYRLDRDSVCKSHERNCIKCIWCYERAHLRSLRRAMSSVLLNSTFGKFFLNITRFANALIFVSRRQRELFLTHAPDVTCPTYVIYNPPPSLPYTPIMGDDVGYFGGPSPLKGFHVLMKAWLKIYNRHLIRLHITNMDRLTVLKKAERLRIFTYGRLDRRFLDKVYRKIKVVVFPSVCQETFGYAALEAILKGRLLIASNVGGIPEMVDGLKGVFVIAPNDSNALAESLNRALSIDREEATELGLKNREEILKKFDCEKSVKQLIKVFEEIIG